MAEAAVKCPHCQGEAVVKYGKTSNGKEHFRCQQRTEWVVFQIGSCSLL